MRHTFRILIVDDHPIFRSGLSQSLSEQPNFLVCGEAASAGEAVALFKSLEPDLVLLDLSMPGGGHVALAGILAAAADAKVLVLTASEDDDDVLRALAMGAKGYALKGIGSEELVAIIDATLAGEHYVPPALAARILADLGPVRAAPSAAPRNDEDDALAELTPREADILRFVAMGRSNKEVARALDLQEKTIKNHMTRIMAKLKVRSRLEAALMLRGSHRD